MLIAAAALVAITAAKAGESPDDLMPLMKDVIAPQAQIVWDASNKGTDDDGKPNGARLDETDWRAVLAGARELKNAALSLAGAQRVTIGPPGVKLQDEEAPGAPTAARVQQPIDKDPKGFADHARALASTSNRLIEAADRRDAALLADAAGGLDGICEACHSRFWYPQ